MQVSVDAGDAEDPPPPSSPPTVVSDLLSYAVPPASVIGLRTCPMPASLSGVTSAFHGFCNFGLPDQHVPNYFPSLPFPTFNQFGNMCSFQDLLQSASLGLLMPQSCPDNVQITPTGPSESELCFNSSPGDNAQIPSAMPSESDLCFNSSPAKKMGIQLLWKLRLMSPDTLLLVLLDSDDDSDCLDVFRQTDSCSASKVNKHPELAKDLFNEKSQDINPINNENATEDACEETPCCECINGNPYMHVITDELPEEEQEGVGWKKRKTTKKGERRVRSDCRIPKGMGPIEIAMRNAPNRKTKYIFEPVLGLTFDSENEAFEFYNMYSYEAGFGIKKSTLKKNGNKFQTLRELRCLCSGGDDRVEYKTKKTGCQAMIRLHRTSDDGWFISCIRSEHNHPLTETCGETKEWFSHKKIDQSTKDMIKYLRENNVSLTKVNCIMGSIFGSMHNSPLTKRSLRTICSQIVKDQMDDDVQKTLEVFRKLRAEDPGFQFSVDPDEHNRIKSLLWINGKSRYQYQYFGDVITFDTTYCTNIYKMPFGLFVGVNNHFQTVIFGGVFMKEETTESFEWVFFEFISLMGGKLPQTILTDQCKAMTNAIGSMWPSVKHLWCKWHIFKYARTRLGPIYRKRSPFRKVFHRIIHEMMTKEEFEKGWSDMLKRFKLQKNEYLENLYFKREKWAKAYFKDSFCARMCSTQRSESANHMLKRFVPRNCSMNRFVEQFNKLLFNRNAEEDRAQFETKIVRNVRRREWPVEEHAMTFYTAAAYDLFRKEVDKSSHYFAKEEIKNKLYRVLHVKPLSKPSWAQQSYMVEIKNDGESYECQCGLYQHFGILCSHVIRVMVQLGISEIPEAHIMKRWTYKAIDVLPGELNIYQEDSLSMQSMMFRQSYLYVNGMKNVNDGNRDINAFKIVAHYQKKAQKKLAQYFKSLEASEKEATTAKKNKHVDRVSELEHQYYTTGSESGSDIDIALGNTYGASGSSACMSDTELQNIKAPSYKRKPGRPKATRFKSSADEANRKKRKASRRNTDDGQEEDQLQQQRKKIRCGSCDIIGHSSTSCKKKIVDVNSEIPEC
ncbi:hypothetical protein EJB05_41348 [Eragrostis curvula]|uniref:SWIM-type domain-containing protein n=1 Tax=Eragrostis curvula TaxID=38414 RepID=A0A5J9T9P8_9POAL|nr:hypothetical protein EJB05_41348 [Eragrostis curvula]